jgi:hypothetical protein
MDASGHNLAPAGRAYFDRLLPPRPDIFSLLDS